MTITQIENILTNTFADAADKAYWEEQLKEAKRKAHNFIENQENARLYMQGVATQ